MCLAACYWARLDAVYYAASQQDAAAAGFDDAHIYDQFALPEEQRALLQKKVPVDDAVKPFEAWRDHEGRIDY